MTRLCIIPIAAFTLSGFVSSTSWFEPAQMSEQILRSHVGVIEARCCRPGRRWGCDPVNFQQSGCTKILRPMNCRNGNWVTMQCTSADCRRSNAEHKCEVDIKIVRHNRCRPTGHATTVGCPEEQWQCEVEMQPYTNPSNPKSAAIVCDESISTLCGINYSPCD